MTRRKDKGSVGDGTLLGEMVLKWGEGWGLQEEGEQQSHWAVKSQARVGNRLWLSPTEISGRSRPVGTGDELN